MFAGSDWLKSDKRNLHGQQQSQQKECGVCYEYPETGQKRTRPILKLDDLKTDRFENLPMSRRVKTCKGIRLMMNTYPPQADTM